MTDLREYLIEKHPESTGFDWSVIVEADQEDTEQQRGEEDEVVVIDGDDDGDMEDDNQSDGTATGTESGEEIEREMSPEV